MKTEWTSPQILTSVLGVLGFLLSCYNYLIVQSRKDKDDRQRRLADVRFRFSQQRQEALELATIVQLAAIRKKQMLQDILQQARQAGLRNEVNQLQSPAREAEKEIAEVDSYMKELVGLTLPENATLEVIQKLEESYGKVIGGLKMARAGREAELIQVDRIIEIVKGEIAKTHP